MAEEGVLKLLEEVEVIHVQLVGHLADWKEGAKLCNLQCVRICFVMGIILIYYCFVKLQ